MHLDHFDREKNASRQFHPTHTHKTTTFYQNPPTNQTKPLV